MSVVPKDLHPFDILKETLGVAAGYVALLSPNGTENEVLFLDAGGLDCTVDQTLPMPIRGLRLEAYSTGKPVYDNDFSRNRWQEMLPQGHVALENVLSAPLVIDGKTVGVIGQPTNRGDSAKAMLERRRHWVTSAPLPSATAEHSPQCRKASEDLEPCSMPFPSASSPSLRKAESPP